MITSIRGCLTLWLRWFRRRRSSYLSHRIQLLARDVSFLQISLYETTGALSRRNWSIRSKSVLTSFFAQCWSNCKIWYLIFLVFWLLILSACNKVLIFIDHHSMGQLGILFGFSLLDAFLPAYQDYYNQNKSQNKGEYCNQNQQYFCFRLVVAFHKHLSRFQKT